MEETNESEPTDAIGLYHRRLVHFHYIKNTEEHNKLHHDALLDPLSTVIRRLFDEAGAPWQGETHGLEIMLIEAMKKWERLMGKVVVPCPVEFESKDLHKTKELSKRLQLAYSHFEAYRALVGFETETWVPNGH